MFEASVIRICFVAMSFVVALKGFWFFLMAIFFTPRAIPLSVALVFVLWLMLGVSLYLFVRRLAGVALVVACVATLSSVALFVSAGPTLIADWSYRVILDILFLLAAIFAYKRLQPTTSG
jgi:hypothetical protein